MAVWPPPGANCIIGSKSPQYFHNHVESGRDTRRICRLIRLRPAIVMPRSLAAGLATSLAPPFALHTARHGGHEFSLSSSVITPMRVVDEQSALCEGNSLQSDSSLSEPPTDLDVNALDSGIGNELATAAKESDGYISTCTTEADSPPPPVNSDYLPLPWKGRLGYVGIS